MRFTRSIVANLRPPSGKPYQIFWDDALPGFGVRVNATTKVWVVQYRAAGKSRRHTIGRTDAIALEAARENAKSLLARVQLGADPHQERILAKASRAMTLGTVIERYLTHAKSRLKPRSFLEVERHLRKHWKPQHELEVASLSRGTLALRLEEIATQNGPFASNRARASMSAFLSYAMAIGLLSSNPLIGSYKAAEEVARDHVLTDKEIRTVWAACGSSPYGQIVRLLLLTAQRREEVGGLRRSEIDQDFSLWTIPGARTKNSRDHEIPISRMAADILSGAPLLLGRDHLFGTGLNGFSGWSKAKKELDAKIAKLGGIRPWRLHDLRRTAATGMGNLGVQPHVVEAVLNHLSGSKSGVAGIYNRATYREEKKAALSSWADHVARLVTEHQSGS